MTDQGVAVGPGHTVVDLGNHQLGGLGDALGIVHRHPVGAIAPLIRGREGDEGHVDGQNALVEQPGGLPKEVGGVVRPPLIHSGPAPGPGEEGVVPKMAGVLGLGILAGAQGQHM